MKLNVSYTKRYYKTATKEVEIPDHVKPEEVDNWLYDNSLELFEDEITSASLDFEDDEFYIEGFDPDEKRRDEIIEKINTIIDEHGYFSVADVEADHSPYLESQGDKLSHLMEGFTTDGGRVYIYDPTSYSSDEIDEYDAEYYQLPLSQLEYVLELAEKWAEIQGEE